MSDLVSVQLYTVREWLDEDAGAALARIASIGYRNVEPFSIQDYPDLPRHLANSGLASPTVHALFLTQEAGPLFELAVAFGAHTIIDTHVPEERWRTADDVKRIAEELNAASVAASEFGLAVALHNHAFEFTTMIERRTAWDIFIAELEPPVRLQIDTYWVGAAGLDPVAVVDACSERVVAMHLKDGPYTGNDRDQVALGQGLLPVAGLVSAAPTALRVVELDDARTDRFVAIEESLRFLEDAGLAQ